MKLTQDQISTIRAALRDYEDKAQSRSEVFTDSTYWAENAETARTLLALFEDALSVEVESVQLEPAKDACGDINCDGQRAVPAPRPMLINRVDLCTSEEETRLEDSLATPAQRRQAARFLQVDLHDLPSALIKRTRERLAAATPPQRHPLAPELLNAINLCTSGADARDVLRNAEPAERRALARHLNIPTNDLLDVITRRLRPALQAA